MDEGSRKFILLLTMMLLELTVAPLVAAFPGGLGLIRALTTLMLLAALWAVGGGTVAILLFLAAAVTHVAASVTGGAGLSAMSAAFRLVFLVYVVVRVVWSVLHTSSVTLDTVAGAACAYMLLGLVWGELYVLVEYWQPGSFYVPPSFAVGSNRDLRAALTYFSFITLTTVGYGVIHPQQPGAGGLCAAEALVGQLYLAIMIARMVGLHTARPAA